MAENKMLNQEEIDALLRASSGSDPDPSDGQEIAQETTPDYIPAAETDMLDEGERDALGEIGNISMGSAATTLSELLGQKVVITSPKVLVTTQNSLFRSFTAPYIIIQVEYKAGLEGVNVLVIKLKDAIVMSNLMMGRTWGDLPDEISDIEISAASEAMNQMIGTGSTSLATVFGRSINISPPTTTVLNDSLKSDFRLPIGENVVVVSFDMKIGNLLDTGIMQILSIETAKREAALLWHNLMGTPLPEEEPAKKDYEEEVFEEDEDSWLSKDLWPGEGPREPDGKSSQSTGMPQASGEPWPEKELGAAAGKGRQEATPAYTYPEPPQPQYRTTGAAARGQIDQPQVSGYSFPGLSSTEQRKLELLLEVPLKVSVVLGRTKRPIKEVLNLTPGAIVELNSLVDEPVEILVNGTLVARGEVVVVNENFGVRIINIISLEERLKQLKE
ncbi:MAG: flagellar motor switch phosphatase FliY [Firmicutes bacterium]|nr:flagellar motor switch phosphatase FliY [Bacillota bacterium]